MIVTKLLLPLLACAALFPLPMYTVALSLLHLSADRKHALEYEDVLANGAYFSTTAVVALMILFMVCSS